MNLEEAYHALGLRQGAPEKERFQAYQTWRDRLREKRDKAPTPGLEVKYAEALKRIDEAIESVESSIDAKELPIFAEVAIEEPVLLEEDLVEEESSGQDELRVFDELETPEPEAARPGSRSWRIALGGVLAVLVLLAGVWFLKNGAIEHERLQAEIEAVRLAEVERLATEAAQAEAARQAALLEELEAKRAPLDKALAGVERKVKLAEEKLHDLEGADRVAKANSDSDAGALTEYRLQRYQSYLEWLRSYFDGLPVKALLDRITDLVKVGELVEAIAAIGESSLDISKVDTEIAKAEQKQYANPVDRFLVERQFAQAVKDAELFIVQRAFRKAVDSIAPFGANSIVGTSAGSKLKLIYRLKSEDAFKRAQDAADLGEFGSARTILETLDGDPDVESRSESQLELIEKLNSEYALEQALVAADEALNEDDFDRASELLSYLVEDSHVGERVREDLVWIGEMEEIWKRNTIALKASDESTATPKIEEAMVPDKAPELTRKVNPIYPDELRKNNVSGFVELFWTVGVDGKAKDIDIVSSSRREFELPAVVALKKWKFKPAEKDGVAVELKVRQRIQFNPK